MPPAAQPQQAFRLGYRSWLDGLRGVAILLVFVGHLYLVLGGFLGVDLFFVLSGFLITTLLVEEWERDGRLSLRRFYARRALRLFPALAAVLLVGLVCTRLFCPPEQARSFQGEAVVAACYVANWPALHPNTSLLYLGHTWSLSLEEQFYLLWPLALVVLLRAGLRRRWVLAFTGFGIATSCAVRLALHQSYRAEGQKTWEQISRLYMGLHTRADALLIGCLIGLLAVWGLLPAGRTARRAVAVGATASAVVLGLLVATRHVGHSQLYDGEFTLVALGFGTILVHLLVNPGRVWRRVLEFPPLMWLGRISYSLYLVHMPLFLLLYPAGLQFARWTDRLLVSAVALAVAATSHYLVERPFLKLKNRSRVAPPASLPAAPAPEVRKAA